MTVRKAIHILTPALLIAMFVSSHTRRGRAADTVPADICVIRAQYMRGAGRIQSLFCKGEMVGYTVDTPRGVTRRSRHVFAVADGRRYAEHQHLIPGLRWQDDLEWNRVFIRPGFVAVLWPVNAYAKVSRKAADPLVNPKLDGTYFNIYMRCTGWWPSGNDQATDHARGRDDYDAVPLCFFLESAESAELHDTVDCEYVGGRHCRVLHRTVGPIRDDVWLDADRRYALVRRRLVRGDLEVLFENDLFVEVADGAWLPRRVRQRVLVQTDKPDEPRVQADATFTADEIAADAPATEKLFDFSPPPASIVSDWDAETAEMTGGAVQPTFDDLLDVARRHLSLSRPLETRDAGARWRHRLSSLVVVSLFVGAVAFTLATCVPRRWLALVRGPD